MKNKYSYHLQLDTPILLYLRTTITHTESIGPNRVPNHLTVVDIRFFKIDLRKIKFYKRELIRMKLLLPRCQGVIREESQYKKINNSLEKFLKFIFDFENFTYGDNSTEIIKKLLGALESLENTLKVRLPNDI